MRFIRDTRTGNRAASVQVIAAGHPRCATSSLQAALESPILGYDPCMHMAHIAPFADRLKLCAAAMQYTDKEKRQKVLHEIFDGYAATADFPGSYFADDLMDMYPDAAIILNTRKSATAWMKSMNEALMFFGSWKYIVPCYLWTTDRLHYRNHQVFSHFVGRRFGYTDFVTEKFYHDHNNWVRAEAKKRGRKVLEWQAEDGYAPICEFLGKPQPPSDVKFPHLNDAATMTMVKRILVIRGLVSWALLGGSLWAAYKYSPSLVRHYLL